jgi:hypothetical protein
MNYYYGLSKSKSPSKKSVQTSKKVSSPKEEVEVEDFISYRRYPYKHHSLGSRPKISNSLLDESIATALELVNKHPEITNNQLEIIESKIKDFSRKKNKLYLEPTEKTTTPKSRKIKFAPGTKLGGKKYTKRNKKQNRTRRNRR